MKSQKIRIEGVGEVLLERSRRAKHICLSIRPRKGIRVAVPYGVPFEKAREVTRSKTNWMQKHLQRMARLEDVAVRIKTSRHLDPQKARRLLVDRLEQLSAAHGYPFNKVFVRRQKTRWGSCSGKNNINLNLALVRLPAALMDYVILHELVHTRIKDHSPRFWEELNRLVPNARMLDRALNRYEGLLLF
jgi:hypothetical protein